MKNVESFSHYSGVPLCAGKGSRIRSVTAPLEIPKPLLEVNGKPLLQHTIDILDPEITPHLVYVVGEHAEKVTSWIGSNDKTHSVIFVHQSQPGALGAMKDGVSGVTTDKAVVANTDEVRIGFSLTDAIAYHESNNKLATLVTAYASFLSRHRVITTDDKGLIVNTEKHPEKYISSPDSVGLVNAGIIIFDCTALQIADYNHDNNWSGILDPLVAERQIGAYIAPNVTYMNVGTPEEYAEAQRFFSSTAR